MEEAVEQLLEIAQASYPDTSGFTAAELDELRDSLRSEGIRVSELNNRRYLGNKHSLTPFIREVVDSNCGKISSVADVFAGTGAVANAFKDKQIVTNDLLHSNYLANVAWFSPETYRPQLIVDVIALLNSIRTSEQNYVRENFADTYFSADDCSLIGLARGLVQRGDELELFNPHESAILTTAILYGMDRTANTVGHYDAYRKGAKFSKPLEFPVLLPAIDLNESNQVLNADANQIVESLHCDVLYLDPPYNSRQYSDAYHLLENIARWEKPEVFGVARKMDRTAIKSDYNTKNAPAALRDLVDKARAKYVLFSYNNMAQKGNGRSNAKISDEEILEILSQKGKVTVFEASHRAFSAGKSSISDHAERLFLCEVGTQEEPERAPGTIVRSPINYIGGKARLMPQLQPLLPRTELFVDLFAGGCTVGANVDAKEVWFNDNDFRLMNLMEYLTSEDPRTIEEAVQGTIDKYDLSDTFQRSYASYGVDSSAGLASVNKEPYLKLRADFNSLIDSGDAPELLYALVIFGFNNQIRFNRSGKFNLPAGKRDFNSQMRRKLHLFSQRLSMIDHRFTSRDFRDVDITETPKDTIFYCDPPYLITQATYNENGGWSEKDEMDLLSFLDRVSESGRRFALSNVLEAKGRSNAILKEWVASSSVNVHDLTMSYHNSNYQRSRASSTTLEVLVTNY